MWEEDRGASSDHLLVLRGEDPRTTVLPKLWSADVVVFRAGADRMGDGSVGILPAALRSRAHESGPCPICTLNA